MFENESYESCEMCSFEMAKANKKILMVVSQTEELKESHPIGVWFEEFAVPYLAFSDKGYEVTVASPKGGSAPIDPASLYNKWEGAKEALGDTEELDTIDFTKYDALILPGGHGPLFDLYKNETLGIIINDFSERNKLIAAICHGPAGLLSAKKDGIPFVNGRKLTCFTNEEEIYSQKESLIPFFLEDALKDAGAYFVQGGINEVNVVKDNNLITAQNYCSTEAFTKEIIKYLED